MLPVEKTHVIFLTLSELTHGETTLIHFCIIVPADKKSLLLIHFIRMSFVASDTLSTRGWNYQKSTHDKYRGFETAL